MKLEEGRIRIFALEDNPVDWFVLEELLMAQFPQATVVHKVKYHEFQAHLGVDHEPFDVILLDLSLPDMRGEDLIVNVLKLAGDVPVIALTGYSNLEFSVHSISLGVSDYLVKNDIIGPYVEMAGPFLKKSIIYSIERKKSLLRLREVERMHNTLFYESQQPQWVVDVAEEKIVQVNEAALKSLGYTEEEFTSLPLDQLGLLEEWDRFKPLMLGEETDSESSSHTFRLKGKSGTLADFDIHTSLVTSKGKKLIFVTALDVTEKLRFEQLVSNAIIKTQEDERFEIGAELHDNVCQQLAHAQLTIGLVQKHLQGKEEGLLQQGLDSLNQANEQVRNISHLLAPSFVRDSNLNDALGMLLETFNAGQGYEIELHHSNDLDDEKLSPNLRLNIYRITQEQLRNIQKHSNATLIEVDLFCDETRLTLRIADNGTSSSESANKPGIGLSNIQRRAAIFGGGMEVERSSGNGFELVVWFPGNFTK